MFATTFNLSHYKNQNPTQRARYTNIPAALKDVAVRAFTDRLTDLIGPDRSFYVQARYRGPRLGQRYDTPKCAATHVSLYIQRRGH